MFTGRGTFSEACALVVGFDLALGGDTLSRFHEWLFQRSPDGTEYFLTAHVSRRVTGSFDIGLSEAQDEAAVAELFDLLAEFLADEEHDRRTAQAREHVLAAARQLPGGVTPFIEKGFVVAAFRDLVRQAEAADAPTREAALPALHEAYVLLRQDRHQYWRRAMGFLAGDAVRMGIQWRAGPEICVFVATPDPAPPAVDFSALDPRPHAHPPYPLEDETGLLPGWSVTQLDLGFDEVPEPLTHYLRDVLRIAHDATGGVVWLGFEGSFDFRGILTPDVATSVYGVCGADIAPQVAVDRATLESDGWAATVAAARERLTRASG